MKIRWYVGNALAGYLDFCVGILIAVVCAIALGKVPSPLLLLWGAVAALLPDVDLVWPVLRGRIDSDHRTTLWHRPAALFLGLTIFFVAIIDITNSLFVIVAYTCVLWHYIHDTPDGIAWLWPFSEKKYRWNESSTLSHEEALSEWWYRPSIRSIVELTGGSIALYIAGVVASWHGAPVWLVWSLGFVWVGTFFTTLALWWYARYEQEPA